MQDLPSHRYLFHSYVYQYHLMRFSSMVLEMVSPSFVYGQHHL